jgi:hypothetical protein
MLKAQKLMPSVQQLNKYNLGCMLVKRDLMHDKGYPPTQRTSIISVSTLLIKIMAWFQPSYNTNHCPKLEIVGISQY